MSSKLELKIPPLVVLGMNGVFMRLVAVYVPEWTWVTPEGIAIAIALGIAGIALILAGAIAFRAAKTTVNPLQPSNASAVVTKGVYAISRNPMYLGFLLILLSWAVYLSNAISFAGLFTFVWYMNRYQIFPEERALLAKFGEEYAIYQRNVRRWL